MKTVNVAGLQGEPLNWAVAKSDEEHPTISNDGAVWLTKASLLGNYRVISVPFRPSTDWSQCGPLIDSYIGLMSQEKQDHDPFYAETKCGNMDGYANGSTYLIAACRAIVAAKFGDTVEVPEELL